MRAQRDRDRVPSCLSLPHYPRPFKGIHPPHLFPDYRSTVSRSPSQPPLALRQELTEVTGPLLGQERVVPLDSDLTQQHDYEPIGQRIIVSGRVLDSDGRAVPDTLIEIWQANAAGRYRHEVDRWPAPLDANFSGLGRTMTDSEGRYRFTTIKPGAYPWSNHYNAWRPAHIHFSLFGRAFLQRTRYPDVLPDDPLFPHEPDHEQNPGSEGR